MQLTTIFLSFPLCSQCVQMAFLAYFILFFLIELFSSHWIISRMFLILWIKSSSIKFARLLIIEIEQKKKHTHFKIHWDSVFEVDAWIHFIWLFFIIEVNKYYANNISRVNHIPISILRMNVYFNSFSSQFDSVYCFTLFFFETRKAILFAFRLVVYVLLYLFYKLNFNVDARIFLLICLIFFVILAISCGGNIQQTKKKHSHTIEGI